MTRDELLKHLTTIEWDNFEVKEAQSELPKNIWETVSAFANTAGGWIVLGVAESKVNGQSQYSITGVHNAEKLEQDFITTARSRTKFNAVLNVAAKMYTFDGKIVLLFHILSSPFKPIYFNHNIENTYIRSGSGDQRATEMEIMALQREQAFGCKSELTIPGTSIADLSKQSLDTYRRTIANFNPEFPFNNLNDEDFCTKIGIVYNGELTYGSLLMLGKWDVLRLHVRNFWIDYLEIPGTSFANANTRYTFRMQEYENLWEYYNVIIQRLRNFVDNPFTTGPNGYSPDDNSQLYALREGLVNMLAHADYFSPMHSTIRVFYDRIEFQNPGRFAIDLNSIGKVIASNPRNPSIIRFFRYAKLAENAGYGINKVLGWKKSTGEDVIFDSNLTLTTVAYVRNIEENEPQNEPQNNRNEPQSEINAPQNDTNVPQNKINVPQNGTNEPQNNGNDSKNEPPKRRMSQAYRRQRLLDMMIFNKQLTKQELADIMGVNVSTIQRDLTELRKHHRIVWVGSSKKGHWEIDK
jgi:ATP-dependent DNA helicase RecG